MTPWSNYVWQRVVWFHPQRDIWSVNTRQRYKISCDIKIPFQFRQCLFFVKIMVNAERHCDYDITFSKQINQIKLMHVLITILLHHTKVQYLMHNSKEYLCLHTLARLYICQTCWRHAFEYFIFRSVTIAQRYRLYEQFSCIIIELCIQITFVRMLLNILSWCWWNFRTSANQIAQIGSCDRSRIHGPDLRGTGVWPGKKWLS